MNKKNIKTVIWAALFSSWCLGAAIECKRAVLSSSKPITTYRATPSLNMPFNETIRTSFIATLDQIITTGIVLNETAASNSLMALCIRQKKELQEEALDKNDIILARRLIKCAVKKPFYGESLQKAQKSSTITEVSKDYSKNCWLSFQKDALYELGKVIEGGTTIVMNERAHTVQHMLVCNKHLNALEQQKYRAGLIGLFLTVQKVQGKIKNNYNV